MLHIKYFLSQICFDLLDFIRCNKRKLIILLALVTLGLGLGIWRGISVDNAADYLEEKSYALFKFLALKSSAFSLFFSLLISLIIFCALLYAISFNIIISYMGFIFLFYKSYIFACQLALLVACFKFAALPFLVLCFIPFNLILLCVYSLICGLCMSCAHQNSCYGCTKINARKLILSISPMLIIGVVVVIIECILTSLLTVGLIL